MRVRIAESREAQRRFAREDHLAVVVAGERLAVGRVGAEHRVVGARSFVVNTREGRAQTVFAHLPAVAGVERRGRFGRPQVLAVPESGHVEEAVLVGEARMERLLYIAEKVTFLCVRDIFCRLSLNLYTAGLWFI